jgi:DNA-directed RNA polymerase specialized sigma24 family protein
LAIRVLLREEDAERANSFFHEFRAELEVFIRHQLGRYRGRGGLRQASSVLDSVYVRLCQRVALGKVVLENASQVRGLLKTLAGAKIVDGVRAGARNRARPCGEELLSEVAGAEPDPATTAAADEFRQVVFASLPPSAREILDLRLKDMRWDEIGTHMGRGEEACRKDLRRALAVVVQKNGAVAQVGIDLHFLLDDEEGCDHE